MNIHTVLGRVFNTQKVLEHLSIITVVGKALYDVVPAHLPNMCPAEST